MGRRIIANLLILVVIGSLYFVVGGRSPRSSPTLDTPSPALGRAVATAVHQTLTDPYFAPLERIADYLDRHPEVREVDVDLLTKWAPDDELPTCFVWNCDNSRLQLDHPTSPPVIETVLQRLKEGMGVLNPRQLIYISTFRAEEEEFWLGFIRVPLGSGAPAQMAGVFFSLDHYIKNDVPRLIGAMTNRPRFPLVEFQRNDPPIRGEREGDIALRVMDADGEVYYQSGRTFDPEKMIYSESRYFPKPIVAMQVGWDLRVFSARFEPPPPGPSRLMVWGALMAAGLIASLLFWWGTMTRRPKPAKRPPWIPTAADRIERPSRE